MKNSFSPQSPWLNAMLTKFLSNPVSGEVVVVHHITETRQRIQLEIERRLPGDVFLFERHVIEPEALDPLVPQGRVRGLSWRDTEEHLALANAAFSPFHDIMQENKKTKKKLTPEQQSDYEGIRRWCIELGKIRYELLVRHQKKLRGGS